MDLLRKLQDYNSNQNEYGAEEIKEDHCFEEIDWKALYSHFAHTVDTGILETGAIFLYDVSTIDEHNLIQYKVERRIKNLPATTVDELKAYIREHVKEIQDVSKDFAVYKIKPTQHGQLKLYVEMTDMNSNLFKQRQRYLECLISINLLDHSNPLLIALPAKDEDSAFDCMIITESAKSHPSGLRPVTAS
uniref:Uncharacterized protein n=1 Tax=Ditylenchus dipsaci TaxID=166011 RepID=A0A915DFE1_9BILA